MKPTMSHAVNKEDYQKLLREWQEKRIKELEETRTENIRSAFFALTASAKIRRELTADQVELVGDVIFEHSNK